MDHPGREDPKLSEVKAVLQRLQGLSTEPESAGLRRAGIDPGLARWIVPAIIIAAIAVISAVAYVIPNPERSATSAPKGSPKPVNTSERAATKSVPAVSPNGPPVVQAAAISQRAPADDTPITGAAGLAVPPVALPNEAPADAPLVASPSVQHVDRARAALDKQALEAALGLMTNGRVRAARQQLLAIAVDGSPDVAWALARSYDPNFLGTLPAADAGPDIEEATRWYRAWYAAAVKQGLVADSVSLERIVGSMRQ